VSPNYRKEAIRPSIVHIAGFAAPYGGNFIASLKALGELCNQRGLRQIMVFPEKAFEKEWCVKLREANHNLHFLPDNVSFIETMKRLSEIVLKENGMIIHTHFSQYDVAAWAAKILLTMRGKKVGLVWHAHSEFGERNSLIRQMKDLIKYRLMGQCTILIAVSDHVKRQALKAGVSNKRIRLITNGIDLLRATAGLRSKDHILRDLNVPNNTHLLLLFGWDPITKGVDTAISATEILVQNGKNVTLGLVGMDKLQTYVLERTNNRLPHWLKLLNPIENVSDYYNASSIFISASRNEGFPYSICEAMAHCVPVVLSDISGCSYAHQTPGVVFFNPGDSSGLREAIESVLAWTPDQRNQYVAANKQFVSENHNVNAWTQRILGLYQEMLKANIAV
jgi:glycosyltransferase involved in cell wall biosynthesis